MMVTRCKAKQHAAEVRLIVVVDNKLPCAKLLPSAPTVYSSGGRPDDEGTPYSKKALLSFGHLAPQTLGVIFSRSKTPHVLY